MGPHIIERGQPLGGDGFQRLEGFLPRLVLNKALKFVDRVFHVRRLRGQRKRRGRLFAAASTGLGQPMSSIESAKLEEEQLLAPRGPSCKVTPGTTLPVSSKTLPATSS